MFWINTKLSFGFCNLKPTRAYIIVMHVLWVIILGSNYILQDETADSRAFYLGEYEIC